MTPPLLDRLWARVDKTPGHGPRGDCWIWTGCHNGVGYGVISSKKKMMLTHRVAYEALVKPIAKGLVLDHLCRNPICCNPAHLDPVTNSENLRRGDGPRLSRFRQKSKTHCKRGHPLSGDNIRMEKYGARRCIACSRIVHGLAPFPLQQQIDALRARSATRRRGDSAQP